MNVDKPKLPAKLPIESRQKLTIFNCSNDALNRTSDNDRLDDSTSLTRQEQLCALDCVSLSENDLDLDDAHTELCKYEQKEAECEDTVVPVLPPPRLKLIKKQQKLNTEISKHSATNELSNSKSISTLESFRSELFKNKENSVCADCKKNSSNWISGLYFITLCDSCAEVHKKLRHVENKWYLIKIDDLFVQLTDEENFHCSMGNFLTMFDQTGNEKINSLLEYSLKSTSARHVNDCEIENFILQKYLDKKFINKNELDLTVNYQNQLDKSLYNVVSGPCLPMTIYFHFLGANLQFLSSENKSLLANSIEPYQARYLSIHRRSDEMYVQISGHARLLLPTNKFELSLTLTADDQLILAYPNGEQVFVPLSSLIRIFTHLNDEQIEIKWLNTANNSFVAAAIEFYNPYVKQLWLKHIYAKLTRRRESFPMGDYHLNSLGMLHLVQNCAQDDYESNGKLVCLMQSLPSQYRNFYKKSILVWDEHVTTELDVRKIKRIKLGTDENGQVMIIDLPSSTFRFKSNGNNLTDWMDKIESFARLEFKSIEDQYLNRDDYPLALDKLCSYVETCFIWEKNFYARFISATSSSTSSVSSASSSHSSGTITKKNKNLLKKLETEREFDLAPRLNVSASDVLDMLEMYFKQYVDRGHLDAIRAAQNVNNFSHQNFGDSAGSLDPSSMIYFTIKRVCIHIRLIANYQHLNNHPVDYLIDLFSKLIDPMDDTSCLKLYVNNFEQFFDTQATAFFQRQFNVIDRLISLRDAYNKRPTIVITAYNGDDEKLSRAIKTIVQPDWSVQYVFEKLLNEFQIENSPRLGLFEVADKLERLVPISEHKFVDKMANWYSFSYVVKEIPFDVDPINVSDFSHESKLMIICGTCLLQELKHGCKCDRKWKKCSVKLDNHHPTRLNIYTSDRNLLQKMKSIQKKSIKESLKVLLELELQRSFVYYGLFDYRKALGKGILHDGSNEKNETILDLDENSKQIHDSKQENQHLSIYNLDDKNLYLMCFKADNSFIYSKFLHLSKLE